MRTWKTISLVSLGLAAGCAHNHASASSPTASPCAIAADRLTQSLAKNAEHDDPSQPLGPEVLGAMHTAVMSSCTNDAWPTSATSCIATAAEGDDVLMCGQSLSDPQQQHLLDTLVRSTAKYAMPSTRDGAFAHEATPPSPAPAASAAPALPPTQSNPDDGGGYTPK